MTTRRTRETDALTAPLPFTVTLGVLLRVLWFAQGMEDDTGERRRGLVALFTSRPGRGKSARIRGAARDLGFHAETVVGSVREPTDFLGLPVQGPGGVTTYSPPAWAVRASEAGHAVVFFDELNRGTVAVQNAMLRVLLEGVVGEEQLPADVRFVCAQNGADSAGVWELGEALANRVLHLDFPAADVQAWASWMLGARGEGPQGFDPGEEAARVDTLWPAAYARAAGLVTAFLVKRPDLFEEELAAGDPRLSGAYATQRSWDMGTRAMASAFVYGLPAGDRHALLGAAVGSAIASEFATWEANADLPDPVEVLDTWADSKGARALFTHNPARLDRTMAFLGSVSAVLLADRCERETPAGRVDARKPRAEAAFGIIHRLVAEGAAEAAVLSTQTLMAATRHRVVWMSCPSWQKALAAMEPFTQATGLGQNPAGVR